MDIIERGSSNDRGEHGPGNGGDGRIDKHHSRAEWSDIEHGGIDGNGGNTAVDRSDAGEPDSSGRRNATVHGDGDVQRQHHAEPDGKRNVGIVEYNDGDDQCKRVSNNAEGRADDDQCDQWKRKRKYDVDGNGGDTAVDRSDTESGDGNEGRDATVHGDGTLL